MNKVDLNVVSYEESVIGYRRVETSVPELRDLAIERIKIFEKSGEVKSVVQGGFLYTTPDGAKKLYKLVRMDDFVALHCECSHFIALCTYQDGIVAECGDIVLAAPKLKSDNQSKSSRPKEELSRNSANDVPLIRSKRHCTLKQDIEDSAVDLLENESDKLLKDSYDLHIHLHMSKAGETKTYKVFGTGYKNIPQSIRDKFYPGGKGKKINVWNFWSRKRFDDNGGIDALRAALPNMKIEFIDVVTDHIAPIIEEPAAEPIVEPAVIVTEEGAASATFPEVKPTAESNAVTKPTVKRGRKPNANAPKSEVLAPKSNGNGKAKVQPDHIHFNDTDKTKIQCIMRKALTKCGNAAKSKVEFFMTAGSNSIVVSIYNDKGQKAKAGTYAGLGWLKMGEGNKDDNNQLVRSLSMISKEFLSIVDENWDGKVA